MDLIGIGALAVAFVLLALVPGIRRRHRRQQLGLPQLPYRENWDWPPAGQTRLGIDHYRGGSDDPGA